MLRYPYNGNQLSAETRSEVKRKLLNAGWSQNSYQRWEHPFFPDRKEHRGFTLFSAAIKEKIFR